MGEEFVNISAVLFNVSMHFLHLVIFEGAGFIQLNSYFLHSVPRFHVTYVAVVTTAAVLNSMKRMELDRCTDFMNEKKNLTGMYRYSARFKKT